MKNRSFGKTGYQTSPIAFGAMRINANSQGCSPELLYSLENGINFIDTARNYGESESIVGKTLKQWKGDPPFISTKVKPLDTGNWRFYVPVEKQFTPQSIVESVESSLRTLGVECIDLVQLHQWYYLWGHRTEWIETLKSLQEQGKIKHIGVSAQDHEHDAVLGLIESNSIDAVQLFVNAFESRPFVSAIPLAEQRDVGVIARCVFDHSGALAGAANREMLESTDVKLSHASPSIVTEYLDRIARLRDLAADYALGMPELSLRFALSHPGVSNVAVSLSCSEHVDEVVRSAENGPLPEELFQKICREHVWVKNFYYFSPSTVDGNKR
jgi:aryl-alcohol dehydrogenase-like predicted oxidoreductase